ncbi:hypothetical protein [Paenibacillus sp. SSG-1]|uniref:hypothetical protein n=1 Tax=Paenibacillus sp. SSG-1 TaxID=1443669 RepID=UPI00211AD1E2|nr:hypothetical protein [Paenibacillus sp. SSG-1]
MTNGPPRHEMMLAPRGEKTAVKHRNVTGVVLAIIYCFVLYGILIEAPPGEVPNHPPWAYLMIPLGAIAITALFDFVIKYDFFKKRNE